MCCLVNGCFFISLRIRAVLCIHVACLFLKFPPPFSCSHFRFDQSCFQASPCLVTFADGPAERGGCGSVGAGDGSLVNVSGFCFILEDMCCLVRAPENVSDASEPSANVSRRCLAAVELSRCGGGVPSEDVAFFCPFNPVLLSGTSAVSLSSESWMAVGDGIVDGRRFGC